MNQYKNLIHLFFLEIINYNENLLFIYSLELNPKNIGFNLCFPLLILQNHELIVNILYCFVLYLYNSYFQ